MKRTSAALVVGALLLAYGAVTVLGVVVLQQRSELSSIEDRLAKTSPVSSTPAATATPSAVFPSLLKVTDTNGHVWLPGPNNAVFEVKPGAIVTLTAVANDPQNRSLQYIFLTGGLPGPNVQCDWGGSPTCQWTAPASTGLTNLTVAIRASATNNRQQAPLCGFQDGCDDFMSLQFRTVS